MDNELKFGEGLSKAYESYNLIIKYMMNCADEIKKKMSELEKDDQYKSIFEKYTTRVYGYDSKNHRSTTHNHAGLIKHHIGVGFDNNNTSVYFLGLSSMNFDIKTKNIHAVLGRVQLMVSIDGKVDAGCPNLKQSEDEEDVIKIGYPYMSEDCKRKGKNLLSNNLEELFKDKDCLLNKRVFYTGYKLWGEERGDAEYDEILTDENIEEFCKLVLNFILKYEEARNNA